MMQWLVGNRARGLAAVLLSGCSLEAAPIQEGSPGGRLCDGSNDLRLIALCTTPCGGFAACVDGACYGQ